MDLFDINDFDFFNTKEYKKDVILNMHGIHENIYSNAIREPIIKLKTKNDTIRKKIQELHSQLSNSEFPTEKDSDIYDMIGDLSSDLDWINEQLYVLNEMRVIYLFKSIEIEMKSLVRTAYPKVDTTSFYNWDNIKAFFAQKGIKLIDLEGYKEVDELRKINNNLKHSDVIDEKTKNILGIQNDIPWDNNLFEQFCKKVEPKVELFKKGLAENVVKELYEFSDFKLDTLTSELYERMDKNDAEKFINKLKNRFSI